MRSIRVRLLAKRLDFESCPACAPMTYADNISLVLDKK